MLISDVGFVRSHNNPADAFARLGYSTPLSYIFDKGMADFDVEQWVKRRRSTLSPTNSHEEKKSEFSATADEIRNIRNQ